MTCPPNEVLQSVSSNGTPTCRNLNSALAGKSCSEGYKFKGFDSNANAVCEIEQLPSTILTSNVVSSYSNPNVSHTFTIDRPGILVGTSQAEATYSGWTTNAGTSTDFYVNGTRCVSDFSFEGESSSMFFTSSATCILFIGPGTYSLSAVNNTVAATPGYNRLAYVVFSR